MPYVKDPKTSLPQQPPVEMKKALISQSFDQKLCGRGERIRTSDSYVPNVVLYQAELRPDREFHTAQNALDPLLTQRSEICHPFERETENGRPA